VATDERPGELPEPKWRPERVPPNAGVPTPPPREPNRFERRKMRIREEIARNRRGEAAIPTWVLALILVLIIGGFTAMIVFA
jgi:hypothetical protein